VARNAFEIAQIDLFGRHVRRFEQSREGLQSAWDDDSESVSAEKRTTHRRAMLALQAKRDWIRRHARRVRISGFLRMVFEFVGPLLFGIYALATAYRALHW
jgi:hypothetical protein